MGGVLIRQKLVGEKGADAWRGRVPRGSRFGKVPGEPCSLKGRDSP